MIPKKIHYVWVGTQEKSELILQCIKSWKQYLPDYEIVEWNNEKFNLIKNKYAEEAFNNKKWAFVSDYLRLHALYHEGGVYLDTDVEITNNIDHFLNHDFFTGYEKYNGKYSPITAVMAARKHNPIIKDLLDEYEHINFETKNGLNMQTNTSRITMYLVSRFKIPTPFDGTKTIFLTDNAIIYPSSHFCTPEEDKENFAIHHFNGSWLDGFSRRTKLNLSNRLSIVRFKKNSSVLKNDLVTYQNEKIIFKVKVSKKTIYALIKK